MTNDFGLDLKISNGFMGMCKRKVKGNLGKSEINLTLGDCMHDHSKGTLKGKIGDRELDLKYKVKDNKNLILTGKGFNQSEEGLNALLSVLILDNIEFNISRDN